MTDAFGPIAPDAISVLVSTVPQADSTPLLAVASNAWPGVEKLFSALEKNDPPLLSSEASFGTVEGRPTIVLSIATLQTDSYVQVALDTGKHRPVLDLLAERGQVALTTPERFAALPNDATDESVAHLVLIVPINVADLKTFLSTGG